MVDEIDSGIGGRNDSSVDAFVERMKERKEAYDSFCNQFEFRSDHSLVITVPSAINSEATDTIFLYSNIEKPQILDVDFDRKNPIKFSDTRFSPHFIRYAALPPEPKDIADEYDFVFDFDEEERPLAPTADYSQEGIVKDLQKKFAEVGLPDVPIMKYARRLVGERQNISGREAQLKADAIVPLYRNLEIARLVTDPNSEQISYTQIAQRRQNVYDQLTELLRESGKDASEITEYLMKGLFDANTIAGVPIFTDRHGDCYVVIDYAFSGYDEKNPTGTDFSGNYKARSTMELNKLLDKAEDLGYTTHFENEFVNGGTHQRWNWHGIKIEGFDSTNPENNTQKVVDLLQQIGIEPQELANPRETDLDDYFLRQVN